MGKITQKLLNKSEIPKLKRRHRRKDLDNIHSRILKTKRKSDNEQEKCNKDRHNKQNLSKNSKYIRPLHTGIFRNGTKGRNIKKDKNIKKGKFGNVVSKARLVGDVLKLFDGESETICVSESTTENETTNQSNTELVKNNLERTSHTLRKSPVLGKNQSKNLTKYLKDVSKKNKEMELVFEPIDIPEVVVDPNFETRRTMKGKKKNEKKEATHSERNKSISCSSRNLHDNYKKLCTKVSDELENVSSLLNCVEDPFSEAKKKIKEISGLLRTKRTQHKAQESSNSGPSTSFVPEYQACTYSSDAQSPTIQFAKNQNNINCPSKSNKHGKKNVGNFSIKRILSMDSNSRRDEKRFDISIIQDNPSKTLMQKQVLTTTPRKEFSNFPTQLDDEEIIVDCDVPNNILQKYSKGIDKSKSTNEKKFCEKNFINMFQNLSTPSTVNRQFHRSKEPESRNNKSMKMKYSGRFEEPGIDLHTNVSNREDEVIRFHNDVYSQAPLEILTAAAAFVETGYLPQTETGNLFTDRYIPISSNQYNSFNRQSSPSYYSQNIDPSNFNVNRTKQWHCANQNTHRCEKRHICSNCPNYSHEWKISQAHNQNQTETTRATVTSGSSYFPMYYSNAASNYVNLPNNIGLPPIPNHDLYTYPQQVDNHQRMVYSQNCSQPVKYFILDNGISVQKIPLYAQDSVCQCQNHGHSSICPY